jgi:hypothetical protein
MDIVWTLLLILTRQALLSGIKAGSQGFQSSEKGHGVDRGDEVINLVCDTAQRKFRGL